MESDPHVPLIGSLPAHADQQQALQQLHRQRLRLAQGSGYSFAIADPETDHALGRIGLWLNGLSETLSVVC